MRELTHWKRSLVTGRKDWQEGEGMGEDEMSQMALLNGHGSLEAAQVMVKGQEAWHAADHKLKEGIPL